MMATAAVFRGPGQPFEFASWPLPEPSGSEVLVEVLACTLCGSDLHSIHGRRAVPTPTVLGHEILGRVVAFGPGAARLDSAGSGWPRGTASPGRWSRAAGPAAHAPGACPRSASGGSNTATRRSAPAGSSPGGLADHCLLVPGTAIFRVPEVLSDAAACPASCATATVAAALEAAGPIRGRSVLVVGAGMLGLTAAAWSREQGAAEVIAATRARSGSRWPPRSGRPARPRRPGWSGRWRGRPGPGAWT